MAFEQSRGEVAWSKNDFGNVYSSPLLINVGGLEQLAILMDGAMIAVNPVNGDLQWQVPFKAAYSIAVATPVWGPDNLLFISSEYDAGTKVIMISAERDDEHVRQAERLGAAAFLYKPFFRADVDRALHRALGLKMPGLATVASHHAIKPVLVCPSDPQAQESDVVDVERSIDWAESDFVAIAESAKQPA